MTMFKGRSAHIGLALERDGEAATTPEYSVPRTESTVKDTIEQIQNDSAVGNIAHYNDQITVGVHGEGDITTKLWHRGLYYFLVGILGSYLRRWRMKTVRLLINLQWRTIITIWG